MRIQYPELIENMRIKTAQRFADGKLQGLEIILYQQAAISAETELAQYLLTK